MPKTLTDKNIQKIFNNIISGVVIKKLSKWIEYNDNTKIKSGCILTSENSAIKLYNIDLILIYD